MKNAILLLIIAGLFILSAYIESLPLEAL